jgi:hypothetical protein
MITSTPIGKTNARVSGVTERSRIVRGDFGYIDGYVMGGSNVVYAIFVRLRDGYVDPIPVNALLVEWVKP